MPLIEIGLSIIAVSGIVVALILVGRHFGYFIGTKRFPKSKVRNRNEEREKN